MTNHIKFEIGDWPWRPVQSEIVSTLGYHGAPTAGILRQGDQLYLFQALVDVPNGNGVWLYTPVDEREARVLSIASTIAFDDLSYAAATERDGVLVLATADGVVAIESYERTQGDTLVDACNRAITQLLDTPAESQADEFVELIPA